MAIVFDGCIVMHNYVWYKLHCNERKGSVDKHIEHYFVLYKSEYKYYLYETMYI